VGSSPIVSTHTARARGPEACSTARCAIAMVPRWLIATFYSPAGVLPIKPREV
jgi:hypothetical protein